MADIQVERAYQRQMMLSQGRRRVLAQIAGKKLRGKDMRFYKKIGLGFRTPLSAIKATYIDKKCPFTSDVSIRGRILSGIVRSTKMQRTIIIRRDYLHYIPKYNRYEKRHATMAVHCSPCFHVKEGDRVTIGECRPLSKTVKFNVLKVEDLKKLGKKHRKQFTKF